MGSSINLFSTYDGPIHWSRIGWHVNIPLCIKFTIRVLTSYRITQYFGFHAIFWFLAILGTMSLVSIITFLPETLRSIAGNGTIRLTVFQRPLVHIEQTANYSHATPLIALLLACHTVYSLLLACHITMKAIKNTQPWYLAGTCLTLLGRNCNVGDAGTSTSTSLSLELCIVALALALACSTKGASSLSNSESDSLLDNA